MIEIHSLVGTKFYLDKTRMHDGYSGMHWWATRAIIKRAFTATAPLIRVYYGMTRKNPVTVDVKRLQNGIRIGAHTFTGKDFRSLKNWALGSGR